MIFKFPPKNRVHHKNQPLHGKIWTLKIVPGNKSLGDVDFFNPIFLGLFQVMKWQTLKNKVFGLEVTHFSNGWLGLLLAMSEDRIKI